MVRAKRAGHMPPKMRFLGAQMAAYLKDGLWLSLARNANASATRLAQALTAAGAELAHPVDGNEVFAILPPGLDTRLKTGGAVFYPWIDGSHRFVCSWATEPSEIDAFASLLT
jgi:threonine aldolase